MTKNKKFLMFAVILLGIVVLGGCGKKDTQLEKTKENKITKEGKQLINGFKEAMKKGVAMKCVSEGEDGKEVVYTNGKQIRSEGKSDGKMQIALVTDGVTYIWEEGAKEGQKMELDCLKDMQKNLEENQMVPNVIEEEDQNISVAEVEKEEAEGKTKCSPTKEADFSVPTNIKFIDQCALIKEQMNKLKDQMPKAF